MSRFGFAPSPFLNDLTPPPPPPPAPRTDSSFYSKVIASSPAAYFRLNRNDLDPVASEVNGWNGVWNGAPSYGLPGPIDGDQSSKCVYFDGTADAVNFQLLTTNYYPPTGTNERTFMGIAKAISAGSSSGYICYGSAAAPSTNPGERVNMGGALTRQRFHCNPRRITSNLRIFDGKWHISFWRWPAGAAVATDLGNYCDGNKLTVQSSTAGAISTVAGLPMMIGGHSNLSESGINIVTAYIAEVAAWDRALTATEIYDISRAFMSQLRRQGDRSSLSNR